MIVGIDGSNIRGGGGITHLVELLAAADPAEHEFSEIHVWSGRETLQRIAARPWLNLIHLPHLDGGLLCRAAWQRLGLSSAARAERCNVLLVPGGSYAGNFQPVVAMSRNMLPFEWRELGRYGCSLPTLKNLLLRGTQGRTFRRADGVIFLTQYARDRVLSVIREVRGIQAIVPHGIDPAFSRLPRPQRSIGECSLQEPFRLLYVSVIEVYKHQWNVARAVQRLRADGLPVSLQLVGPSYPPALRRLRRTLERIDPAGEYVKYSGIVPHGDLPRRYAEADIFVFASSCENLPNILFEGMASGLPIACSNLGPMPEVLGDAGVYFNPTSPEDIARALRTLILSPDLRTHLAAAAYARTRRYSWSRCAAETFDFLRRVASAPLLPVAVAS